ncbi:MAG: efflux RND transporter permease subunit, partial [Bacteroidota bacterium]
MRSIIKFFIQHPIILNLCVFLIIGLGFIKLTQTQVTYFPKQRIRFLTVLVPYPGASPSEVETGITKKIEDNLEGIEGIDRVTSTSANSLATVVVELTEASDDKAVLAEVKNAVDKINNFPDRAEPPIIEKVKVKDLAMTLGIRGNLPFSAMKDYADVIEDDLLASSAISEIIVEGLPAEEIAVEVRDNDLQRYQLSFFQVVSAVQKANLETFGGEIKTGSNNISIKANNKKYFAKELSEIIVSADVNGRIVRLKDVADIKDQFADVATGRYIENQQVITLSTFALPSEDILEVASITQSYIENFNKNHSGVYLQVLEDGTIKVNDQINTMVNNGLVGILLVLIVLALFLDRYLAFWVALKIPFAIIGMFLIAGIQGLTINVVSLFGFVLVLGILVDDGVVIGENIYQWAKKKGVTPQKAAIEGTMEMLVPVLISLTTTVVAFSLFFFLPTQTGEFFGEMGFVVVAVLLFAMLESFFFLPAHLAHSRGLKANHTPSFIERFFNRVLNFINEKIYLPTYRTLSIGNRWVAVLTLVLFIVMLGGAFSLVGTGKVGFTFFPNLDDDAVFTELQMKPGTPVEVVQNKLTALEEAVWKVNKEYSKDRTDGQQVVQYVERITGPQPNEGKLKITFLTGEERGISSFVLSNAMRDMSPPMPEAESLVFGIGATLAVFGKPVSVALYSQNMEELRLAKDALKEEMGVRTDIKDISDTDQIGVDEIEL